MKKYQAQLLKLANKFYNKYAQSQTLQQIIENAAGYGEKSANGIMNFPAQLVKDQADLAINVTVTSTSLGGYNIDVSQPTVEPAQFAGNYAKLPLQLKNYLEKNIKNFPQVQDGTNTLRFSGVEGGVATK
jgi:hypothetical protein